jgi:hypothetical protein
MQAELREAQMERDNFRSQQKDLSQKNRTLD